MKYRYAVYLGDLFKDWSENREHIERLVLHYKHIGFNDARLVILKYSGQTDDEFQDEIWSPD